MRSAADAWATVKTLLQDTLERSSDIPNGSVASALAPVDGLASVVAASSSSTDGPFTLIAGDMHLDIYIARGIEAFTVEENLAPVPGGSSAPSAWVLYIQPPAHLRDTVTAAIDGAEHLEVGRPTTITETTAHNSASAPAFLINESALRRHGGAR